VLACRLPAHLVHDQFLGFGMQQLLGAMQAGSTVDVVAR
jgi:hypothetical protein